MKNWNFSEYVLGVALVATLFTGAMTFYFWGELPPLVPFLYSLPWGDQQLIKKEFFAGGLIIAVLINVLNYLLAKKMVKGDEVVSMTISGSSVLVTSIYLISYWQVLLIIK